MAGSLDDFSKKGTDKHTIILFLKFPYGAPVLTQHLFQQVQFYMHSYTYSTHSTSYLKFYP